MTLAAVMQVLVTANTSQATASLGRFQRQMLATEASTVKRTQGIARAFRTGALAVGLIGAASGKMAIEFDKDMRNVNSIAQLPEKQFKKLEDSVRSLAGPTAQSPRVLAEGLYDLVSSGFDASESMTILKASSIAATAGLTDTATSTKAVAAVLNAYQRPAKDAKKVSDDLFQTVNLGVVHFDELAQTIGDGLPFAAQMGVNIKALGAAITTMTRAGLSPAETMTRIKNVMIAMLKPSEALKDSYKQLGVEGGPELIKKMGGGTVGFQRSLEAMVNTTLTANDLKKAYADLGVSGMDELAKKSGGFANANMRLAETLSANATDVAQLFPNIRALGGALALTGGNTKAADQNLKGFADTAGATQKVFKEQSKSVALQWNRTKALLENTAISIGDNLLPVLFDVMKVVTDPKISIDDKFSMVFDRIFQAAEDLAPKLLVAGGEIAKNLFLGILHSSPPVQLLTGLFLFKAFGGFAWMGALAATAASKFWEFFVLNILIDSGIADAAIAIAGALGTALTFALPVAIAGIGLYNILTSVMAGDAHDAGFKIGGAIAGGIAGFLLGGPLGALLGGGLGSVIGGLLGDLFGGDKQLNSIQQHLETSSHNLTDSLKRQSDAMSALKDSSSQVRSAHKREHDATQKVNKAEGALAKARKQYPAHSIPVLNAEADLAQAKAKDMRVTHQLKAAEKLHGVSLDAAKLSLKGAVGAEHDRINALRDDRQELKKKLAVDIENIKTYGKTADNMAQLRTDQTGLTNNTKGLRAAQKEFGDTLQQAATQVGPKFARMLKENKTNLDQFGGKIVHQAQTLHDPFNKTIFDSTDAMEHLGIKSNQTKTAIAKSIDSMSDSVTTGMGLIQNSVNIAANGLGIKPVSFTATKGNDKKQKKAKGGVMVGGVGEGDKIPALLEPGEVVWNKRAVASMGGVHAANLPNEKYKRYAKGGTGTAMDAMIALGNAFDAAPEPYQMGGGHGSFLTTPSAVDCSGAVSAMLHAGGLLEGAPMDTVALAGWGKPATGSENLVVATRPLAGNAGHTVVKVNGRVFGTSGEEPGGGAGWLSSSNPRDYVSGAVLRTMDVKGNGEFFGPGDIDGVTINGPNGALKNISQAAVDYVSKGAGTWLSDHMPTGTGGGGDAQNPMPTASGALSQDAIRGLLDKTNMPDIMGFVSYAESGWIPTNGNGTYNGLWAEGAPFWSSYAPASAGPYYNWPNPLANAQTAAVGQREAGMAPWEASRNEGAGGGWGQHLGQTFSTGGVVGQKITDNDVPHIGVPYNPTSASGHLPINLIHRLGAQKGKTRHKAMGNLMERVKGVQLGQDLFQSLNDLSSDYNKYQEWADRANSLNIETDNPDGTTTLTPGVVNDKDEGQWLQDALGSLWQLRKQLLAAESQVGTRNGTIAKMLATAKKQFDKAAKFVRQTQKDIKANEKLQDITNRVIDDKKDWLTKETQKAQDIIDKEQAKPKKHRNQDLIHQAMDRIEELKGDKTVSNLQDRISNLKTKKGGLSADLLRGTRERDALKDKLIPSITKRQSDLTQLHKDIMGDNGSFYGLTTVQGIIPEPLKKYDEVPVLGELGGYINDVQDRLNKMGLEAITRNTPDVPVGSDTTDDLNELYKQLAIEAQQRYLVSEQQASMLSRTPTIMGAFAAGGTAREKGAYLVGEREAEVINLDRNDTVTPVSKISSTASSGGASSPTVNASFDVIINGDINNVTAGKQPVEVRPRDAMSPKDIVKQGGRGQRTPLGSSRGF